MTAMAAIGSKLLCRLDIAVLLSITVRQVARNEVRLGLRPYRVMINQRVVRYHCAEALHALKERGFIR
jgi:hypothetical protein